MTKRMVLLRGPVIDILRFFKPLLERRLRIRLASDRNPQEGAIAALASQLHPGRQELVIRELRRESPDTLTYIMSPADSGGFIAPFRSGQYLSVDITLEGGAVVTRPYSISNTPAEAERDNAFHLTVKAGDGGVAVNTIRSEWRPGTIVSASEPCGLFTYEPLRDPRRLICIAGGSGVTPFRSLIGDILNRNPGTHVTLLQGAAGKQDVLFDSEFAGWEDRFSGSFRRVVVLSGGSSPKFIDAELIARHMEEPAHTVLFICGPVAMHRYLETQFPLIPATPARIRREDYGCSGSFSGRTPFHITAEISGSVHHIPADPGETVLTALERAGLHPPSRCRTGSCGWCRSILRSGSIRYEAEPEGLRNGDRKYGGFHPCAAFPMSDLLMVIPENPVFDSNRKRKES